MKSIGQECQGQFYEEFTISLQFGILVVVEVNMYFSCLDSYMHYQRGRWERVKMFRQ